MTAEKAVLRREARARLRALPAAERAAAEREIARHVWSLPEVEDARHLLLFASLPEEVATGEIAREARRRGVAVAYPRCLPVSFEMSLHRVDDTTRLRAGEYGIPEPDDACPLVLPEEVDVALVPGLAWSRDGTRLGRGAGYFDRLFASPRWRGFRCGVFFAAQEWPALPADPWDAPLHAVVTEVGALRV
jgi:5-formyltetrahydrofolate cyclo-ligase